jgi:predicted metal-binding protein
VRRRFARPPEGRPWSVHDRWAHFRFGVESLLGCWDWRAVNAHSGPSTSATLLVCVTCKTEQGPLGPGLFEALGERLALEPNIVLKAVECLSVCKRPCTVALAAHGKWTYVIGDLTCESHLDDLVAGARRYAASPDGIVPWRERPLCFRKGVVSRTPPLTIAETAPA